MKRNAHGFTQVELVVVVVIAMVSTVLVLATGMWLSSSTDGRRIAPQMRNGTQIRGIIQGLVLFSTGNNDYYPGVNADGTEATSPMYDAKNVVYTAAHGGADPACRMAILLNGNYFTPEYILSLAESESATKPSHGKTTIIDHSNFSYAMLMIGFDGPEHMLGKAIRDNDWKNTTNQQAVVVSDRNTAPMRKSTSIASIQVRRESGGAVSDGMMITSSLTAAPSSNANTPRAARLSKIICSSLMKRMTKATPIPMLRWSFRMRRRLPIRRCIEQG